LELVHGKRKKGRLTPEEVGLRQHATKALAGGDPRENLRILNDVFAGTAGAYRDASLFNAGAMLYVAGLAGTIADGVQVASEAIDSGKSRLLLENWVRASQDAVGS
jgi:anthranilate phosphoribosyltransferase